jgi:hypothetical protein
MTVAQTILIKKLLTGHFLSQSKSKGKKCYVLYDAAINPLLKIRAGTVDKIGRFVDPNIRIWKTSKVGNITLNISMVRRLHGRNTIKRLYKMKMELSTPYNIYKKRKPKKLKRQEHENINSLF